MNVPATAAAIRDLVIRDVFNDAEIMALTDYLNSAQVGKDASLKTLTMHAGLFPAFPPPPQPRLRLVVGSKGVRA